MTTHEDLITSEMTIEEILTKYPHKSQRLAHEITKAGLHCVGCGAATWETLEAGMLGHGMPPESIERLLKRLNEVMAEEEDLSTITLTSKAAKKFLEILEEEGKTGWGMRFSEEAAGCSGLEYVLDYCQKADEDDETFESEGVNIYVKKALRNRLLGSKIDYVDGLHGAGFKISNPNVRSSCGCGNTHGY